MSVVEEKPPEKCPHCGEWMGSLTVKDRVRDLEEQTARIERMLQSIERMLKIVSTPPMPVMECPSWCPTTGGDDDAA